MWGRVSEKSEFLGVFGAWRGKGAWDWASFLLLTSHWEYVCKELETVDWIDKVLNKSCLEKVAENKKKKKKKETV